jgi:hypothetical protein
VLIGFWWSFMRERVYFEDTGEVGKKMRKWNFNK